MVGAAPVLSARSGAGEQAALDALERAMELVRMRGTAVAGNCC